jgi:hypothetical protein
MRTIDCTSTSTLSVPCGDVLQHPRHDAGADVVEGFEGCVSIFGRTAEVVDQRVEISGVFVAFAGGRRGQRRHLRADRLQVRIMRQAEVKRRAVLVAEGQQHIVRRIGLEEFLQVLLGQPRAIELVADNGRIEQFGWGLRLRQ